MGGRRRRRRRRRDWLREIKFKVVLIASSSSGSPPCKLARRDEEGGVMHSVERERERERGRGKRRGETLVVARQGNAGGNDRTMDGGRKSRVEYGRGGRQKNKYGACFTRNSF